MSPPGFPGVQFKSLPIDRRPLLSERLEQTIRLSLLDTHFSQIDINISSFVCHCLLGSIEVSYSSMLE